MKKNLIAIKLIKKIINQINNPLLVNLHKYQMQIKEIKYIN